MRPGALHLQDDHGSACELRTGHWTQSPREAVRYQRPAAAREALGDQYPTMHDCDGFQFQGRGRLMLFLAIPLPVRFCELSAFTHSHVSPVAIPLLFLECEVRVHG